MFVNLFDLFKVGIGPSSSHTIGPMIAAKRYLDELLCNFSIKNINRIHVEIYGSLALTGIGHGTDKAIMLGLSGQIPAYVDPDEAVDIISAIHADKHIYLLQQNQISFDPATDIVFYRRETLPHHSNGMRFSAELKNEQSKQEKIFYSIGGGFVLDESEIVQSQPNATENQQVPYDFESARELLDKAQAQGMMIADLVIKMSLKNVTKWKYCPV